MELTSDDALDIEEPVPRRRGVRVAALGSLLVLVGGGLLTAFANGLLSAPFKDDPAPVSAPGAAARAPEPTDVRVEDARAHLAADRAEAAVWSLEAALADAPERVDVALLLVEALLASGQRSEAEERLRALRTRTDLDAPVLERVEELEQEAAKAKRARTKATKRASRQKQKLPTDLDEASLREVAGRTRVAARNCYQAHVLRASPTAGGDVTLEVAIEQSGKVSQVLVVDQQVGGPELAACLKALANAWRFPRFRETPKILFQYTFAFRP